MRLSFCVVDSRTVAPLAKSVVPSRLGETLLRDRNTMDSLETLSPQFLYRKTFFPAEIPLLISIQF